MRVIPRPLVVALVALGMLKAWELARAQAPAFQERIARACGKVAPAVHDATASIRSASTDAAESVRDVSLSAAEAAETVANATGEPDTLEQRDSAAPITDVPKQPA